MAVLKNQSFSRILMLQLGDQLDSLDNIKILNIVKLGKDIEFYLNQYCELIDNALSRGLDRKSLGYYTECHHILPICCGGLNEENNYVLLTGLEHILAHILLHYIEPDNLKLASAASFMVANRECITVKRKNAIKLIEEADINLIKYLGNLRSKCSSNSVICCDKDKNILKIYNKMMDLKDDGFSEVTVRRSIKANNRVSRGYYWYDLSSWTSEEELRKIDNYYHNDEESIFLTWGISLNSIIAYTENKKIVRIYSGLNDIQLKEDGFNSSSISNTIRRKKINYYKGYYWYKLIDWLDNDEIIKYKCLDSLPILKLKDPDCLPPQKIVRCDKNFTVLNIYNNYHDAGKDGYNFQSICRIFSKNQVKFKGYYWYKFAKFEESHKDKLEEFYKNDGKIIDKGPDIKETRIVCLDVNHKVIKIYKNILGVKKDGFIRESVKTAIRTEEFYRGYYWKHYSDLDQNKLNEFYNNKEVILVKAELWRYLCIDFNTNEIIKMYKDPKELEKDGFLYSSVNKVIKNQSSHYKGYGWLSYEYAKKYIPEKLEEYYKDHPEFREK